MEEIAKVMRRRPSTVGMGFTAVELILALALLAIMASIVIPRMGWATRGKVQSKTAARQFANYLKLARSLAITHASSNNEGYKIVLLPSSPYTSYTVLDDDTSSIVKGPIEIPTGVTCTGDDEFKFTPLGRLDGGTTLTVQFSKAGDTKVVSVTPIGRITVQ